MVKKYGQGYIVGVEGGALSKIAEAVFTPPTRLYHFLVIDRYIESEEDYEIHEAISSGVRSGRLLWYKDVFYVVFRINDEHAEGLGARACELASDFGRWGYDFQMYAYLLFDGIRIGLRNLIKERRFRRIRPAELPFHENHAFICTEFANALWYQVGKPPIPQGVVPLPAGYVEAVIAGKLQIVGVNIPPGSGRKYLWATALCKREPDNQG